MNLPLADHHAKKLLAWLTPFCERLEVAGSVRRRRPVVNDIDLVALPKTESVKDLLNQVTHTRNLLWEHLVKYAAESDGRVRILRGGNEPGDLISLLSTYQLDVFFATPATWATRLVCRTGSKEHNIWLCDRAADRAMAWDPSHGLRRLFPKEPAHFLHHETEADLYAALGLKPIDPVNREIGWLKRVIDSGL